MMKQPYLPGWDIIALIGEGSFGKVYEIQRDVLGTIEKAALKVITIPQNKSDIEELISEGYDTDSINEHYKAYLMDIVREYSLMSELRGNSNIVDCNDLYYVEHEDGLGWDIYIRMELLTPMTKGLDKIICTEQVIQVGIDLCNALILCKKHNIVHRDIKPQNIFISKYGQYKLGDFGIAKVAEHTTSGTKTGTFRYMAPEVYNNQPYGASADIYSLGIVMYWMLNERRTPFLPLPPEIPTVSMEEEARKRRFSGEIIPNPINGTQELHNIVCKACTFEPEKRYQSPEQMLQDLKVLQYKKENDWKKASFEELKENIVEETYYEKKEQESIPEIPNREELLSRLLGSIQLYSTSRSLVSQKEQIESKVDSVSLKEEQKIENVQEQKVSVYTKKVKKKNKLFVFLKRVFIIWLIWFVVTKGWEDDTIGIDEDTMWADATIVLENENIVYEITELVVIKEIENENYQTYTVKCQVFLNIGEEVHSYMVTLIYENEDDTWILSDLSKASKVEL